MISFLKKEQCCGCGACSQKCPRKCITMVEDAEGFLYPEINQSKCVDCGLCEKVCLVLHPYDGSKPECTLAAVNKDDGVRLQSSSGGIFSVLAEKTINEGGVVFGARFDEQWKVTIGAAETMEKASAFRGSKYLQARVGDSYVRCKHYLDTGRKVLFSGTPCQIAGLRHFLNRDYPNLLAVDFICHGAPSPLVWQRYLGEVVSAGRNFAPDGIEFRDKGNGWKLFSFRLDYNEGGKMLSMSSPFRENLYMRAFLKNLILRPSCHACPAKCGRSYSDITLADFWGIENVNPSMDDDRGTSLVLVNTERGASALPSEKMKSLEVNFDEAIRKNSAWHKSAAPHHRREEFFTALAEGKKGICSLILHSLRPTMRQHLSNLKYPRNFFGMLLATLMCGGGYRASIRCNDNGAHNDSRYSITLISFRFKSKSWKDYQMYIKLGG